mgnify:CR=1 FL=1
MQNKIAPLLILLLLITTTVSAQKYKSTQNSVTSKQWEDQAFSSIKSFAENIAEVPQFSILAETLKNKALAQMLESQEMVTIFAITDAGFNSLPKKERNTVLKNPALMSSIVKYLSVPGRMDSYTIKTMVEKNGGTAYFSTLNGEKLAIKNVNGQLTLFDAENNTATITAPDFYHKNGFFHIVNGVVIPASK